MLSCLWVMIDKTSFGVYIYGLCYLCTRMYVTFFCLCYHQSPLGKDMFLLPFYSWEHDKIHDHILCFSPGLLLHTSYTGIWGEIPRDSSEGRLNLGCYTRRGVLVHKAVDLWHYCITSGVHTSSRQLDIFMRRYRENWKLTCFAWNYARILIKYFIFAVGETCFVTVVIMRNNNGCEVLIKPCCRGWFWWGGSHGLRRHCAHVFVILYCSVWKRSISALGNIKNYQEALEEQCPLDF